MWHTGQADGYLELLQDLIDLATNDNVDSVAVNAGGSGYAVGDILRINGGTTVGGHTAAVEVLTLSGSAVATVRIARGGAYTVNPGTGASTTAETGSGTGCTIDTTIGDTGWTVERRTQEAVSATIGTAGTGYAVNDQLTVQIGDGSQGKAGVDAVFNVDSIGGGGAVTAVSLVTAGNYEEPPSNDALTTTDGSGTGCELTVTYQDATTQDQVVVLRSNPGGGFNDAYVAIETYQDVDQFLGSLPVRNWALFGMPAFNPALPLYQQPGISPGHDVGAGDGGYVDNGVPNLPLKDTDASYPISFWLSITDRRILGFLECTDSEPVFHYPSFYLGFWNQAGTRAEYPYPLYIGGSSWRRQAQYSEETPVIGGVSYCGGSLNTAADVGTPGECSSFFYDASRARWFGVMNFDWNDEGTVLRDETDDFRVGLFPLLQVDNVQDDDPWDVFGERATNALETYADLIDREEVTSPDVHLYPTPDGGDQKYLLIPLTLYAKSVNNANPLDLSAVYGELDALFWISAAPAGSVSTLDTFLVGSDRYRIFQNGNRTNFNDSYVVVLEG